MCHTSHIRAVLRQAVFIDGLWDCGIITALVKVAKNYRLASYYIMKIVFEKGCKRQELNCYLLIGIDNDSMIWCWVKN